MTPIERAARALQPDGVWELLDEPTREFRREQAGAVLQAIREPSGEMLGDVHDTLLYAVKGEELETARAVWERMIDAALEEGR